MIKECKNKESCSENDNEEWENKGIISKDCIWKERNYEPEIYNIMGKKEW